MDGTAPCSFGAPWGRALVVISILGAAILVGIPVYMMLQTDAEGVPLVITTAGCLGLLATCALFTVRGYELREGRLLVRRLLWTTGIDLSGADSVEVDPDAMKGSIRTLGNGGLFSFSGRYRSRRLGSFRALVTNLRDTVVIRLPDRPLVVSPDMPELFAERVRGAIARYRRAAGGGAGF